MNAEDRAPSVMARPRWMSSLRAQLIVGFVAIDIVAATVCAAVVIVKARRASLVEMEGSMRLAETLVGETIRLNEPQTPEALLATLAQQLGVVRHVRFAIYDADGRAVETRRPLTDDLFEREQAPAWFMALVAPAPERRAMPIISRRRKIGAVHIIGAPQDEVAEVWEDTAALATIALLANLAVIATLYFAFGRILAPLTRLARGFDDLERGDFSTRMVAPPVRELAELVLRFNHLAATLGEAHAENRRLSQRLVSLQDDERRRLALDLHDEFGPCFFGLGASLRGARSALAALQAGDAGAAARAAEELSLIDEIVERMRVANRTMLRSLRPMSIGHIPLAEILALLVQDFSKLNRNVSISLAADGLNPSYGEAVDLTVYRCVQESLTNAVRHSGAATIRLAVAEADAAAGRELRLVVEDEGRGVSADAREGFGLKGMKERIEALGGAWEIGGRSGGGARLLMTLPIEISGAAAPRGAEETSKS